MHEGLYTGARPLLRDEPKLKAANINTIVTLCRRRSECEYQREIVHWPIPDSKNGVGPGLEAAQMLAPLVRHGRRLLLHCNAGQNRSPFVAALLIYAMTGRPGLEIVEHLQQVRPNCLTNPWFRSTVALLGTVTRVLACDYGVMLNAPRYPLITHEEASGGARIENGT